MISRASRLKTYLHDDPASDLAEDTDENANAGDDASSLLSCASSSVSVYCTGARQRGQRPNCFSKLFHFCSNSSRTPQEQPSPARLDKKQIIDYSISGLEIEKMSTKSKRKRSIKPSNSPTTSESPGPPEEAKGSGCPDPDAAASLKTT